MPLIKDDNQLRARIVGGSRTMRRGDALLRRSWASWYRRDTPLFPLDFIFLTR